MGNSAIVLTPLDKKRRITREPTPMPEDLPLPAKKAARATPKPTRLVMLLRPGASEPELIDFPRAPALDEWYSLLGVSTIEYLGFTDPKDGAMYGLYFDGEGIFDETETHFNELAESVLSQVDEVAWGHFVNGFALFKRGHAQKGESEDLDYIDDFDLTTTEFVSKWLDVIDNDGGIM